MSYFLFNNLFDVDSQSPHYNGIEYARKQENRDKKPMLYGSPNNS